MNCEKILLLLLVIGCLNSFLSGFRNFSIHSSVWKLNSPVHTLPTVSGFTLEKPGLHVAISFYCSVREISEFTRPHVIRFVASYFFHSEKRIQKYPDSLPNLPDARGRKQYADTTCGRGACNCFFWTKSETNWKKGVNWMKGSFMNRIRRKPFE